jgi:WD40 repeat protein
MLDANRCVIGTTKNVIGLCDIHNSSPIRLLQGHTGSVAAMVARGDRLISGSFDTTVRIWRIASPERENQAALMRHSTALE